jgi:hypothetical protein
VWIFLNNAFLSIVEDRNDPKMLLVRARLPEDLRRVFPGCIVRKTPGADYLYRTRIGRRKVSERMSEAALDVDYPNFKGSVTERDRHDAYLRVWTIMRSAQEPMTIAPPELDFGEAPLSEHPPRRAHPRSSRPRK